MNSNRATSLLLDHWLALGGDQRVPDRLAIDATKIVLAWSITVEVPSLRLRVVGTELDRWIGGAFSLDAAFAHENVHILANMGRRLAGGDRIRRAIVDADGKRATLLLLPLTRGEEGICRAIGAVDRAWPGAMPSGLAKLRADYLTLIHSQPSPAAPSLRKGGF
jgi:hypothetical protein